ncbi:hypothetical protein IFM89_011304 [Coptis chinensis]|uniref:Reverse transcriptase zinc-binding domain-containing protein n=1 Tax=Coptis chinensis TaxID=261450 RepID=A0A835HV27_9MAGN|nr:hypothetical protein IFM89_011304 [Coptis chinensis]
MSGRFLLIFYTCCAKHGIDTATFRVPPSTDEDQIVWSPDSKGVFSFRSAYAQVREKQNRIGWHRTLWNDYVHPRTAATAWKLMHNCAATDAKMQRRGIRTAAVCCMYFKDTDELLHLLWACEFARSLWSWLAAKFGFRDTFQSTREAVSMAKGCSTTIRHMWEAAVVGGIGLCCVEIGSMQVWVETDSRAAMLAFVSSEVPWRMRKRWELCKRKQDFFLI